MTLRTRRPVKIEARTTIREVIADCPSALGVIIERGIPVSCADRTVEDAARIAGLDADRLLADLRAAQQRTETPARAATRMHPAFEPDAASRSTDQGWSRPR